MAKDKRIAEFPGISQSAVVALSRIGVLTATDLINADYERIAVVLDDFNEASRLVREARKFVDGRKSKDAPNPPAPLASGTVSSGRQALRIGSASGQRPAKSSAPPSGSPSADAGDAGMVGSALSAAAMSLRDGPGWREQLQQRLSAVSLLLEHECEPREIAAVLLLEAVESGAAAQGQGGPQLETLLEECLALRAVPVLPTGKPPKYFLEMASRASASARRVCAALMLTSEADESSELRAEALLAGEPEGLVDRLREGLEERQAA